MNAAPFTAGAGATGGRALLLGGTTSHALPPATFPQTAPTWAQRRASLRPVRRVVQRIPRASLARRVIDGAAFLAAVTAACVGLLALGAWLDA